MALVLHLCGVGEWMRLIWAWSVHGQESGDLHCLPPPLLLLAVDAIATDAAAANHCPLLLLPQPLPLFYHCFYLCSPWWWSKYNLDPVIFWSSVLPSPAPSATIAASVSTAVCCWLYYHCRHSLFPTQLPAPCEIFLLGDVQNITATPNLITNSKWVPPPTQHTHT